MSKGSILKPRFRAAVKRFYPQTKVQNCSQKDRSSNQGSELQSKSSAEVVCISLVGKQPNNLMQKYSLNIKLYFFKHFSSSDFLSIMLPSDSDELFDMKVYLMGISVAFQVLVRSNYFAVSQNIATIFIGLISTYRMKSGIITDDS